MSFAFPSRHSPNWQRTSHLPFITLFKYGKMLVMTDIHIHIHIHVLFPLIDR